MRFDGSLQDKILYFDQFTSLQQRIKNMKATIDNSEPKKHPFANKYKLRKEKEEKKIKYENSLICERILKSSEKSSIDNKLSESILRLKEFKQQMVSIKHKLSIDKINKENEELVNRLIKTPPAYDHKKWELEFIKRENLKKTMLKYP
jgi:hypothetical protein